MNRQEQRLLEKYFRRYLAVGPIALALWRSVEAYHVSKVQFDRPVLDIGCGFGEFAGVFFESQVEMGIDIDYNELVKAMKGKKYTSLSLVDARDLPFKEDTFATVLSISTLEHIDKPEKVISEAFRVLKPGGTLLMTIVIDSLNDYIFYGPFFKKIGLFFLGRLYTNTYNKVFKHRVLNNRKQWEDQTRKTGFDIVEAKEIISPKVTRLFDILLVVAWPSQLIKYLTGSRVSIRPRVFDDFVAKVFMPILSEESPYGNTLFVVAKKPSRKKKYE
jgi:ubiquinone/menaquinone biosynthesis C-methylase UbiE